MSCITEGTLFEILGGVFLVELLLFHMVSAKKEASMKFAR